MPKLLAALTVPLVILLVAHFLVILLDNAVLAEFTAQSLLVCFAATPPLLSTELGVVCPAGPVEIFVF